MLRLPRTTAQLCVVGKQHNGGASKRFRIAKIFPTNVPHRSLMAPTQRPRQLF